jgi:uncharacterized protein (DUF2141 family)
MSISFPKPLLLGAFLIVLFTLFSDLEAAENSQLTVNIINTESNEGQLIIYLHNNAEYFPKERDKAFKVIKTTIKNNKVKITFSDIPNGTYAIAVHHDDNGNNKVDTNFLGIPNEDFGASNDAKGLMGPPSFEDASFKVEGNTTITIDMD